VHQRECGALEGVGCTRGIGVHQREWGAPEEVGCTRGSGVHQREWGAPEGLGCTRESRVHQREWGAPEGLGCTRGIGVHQRDGGAPEGVGWPEEVICTRGSGVAGGSVVLMLLFLQASRRRPIRGTLHVSGDGLRVVDDETKVPCVCHVLCGVRRVYHVHRVPYM
jgi:hypothetical protein